MAGMGHLQPTALTGSSGRIAPKTVIRVAGFELAVMSTGIREHGDRIAPPHLSASVKAMGRNRSFAAQSSINQVFKSILKVERL
jgi:hypothetical protein